MIAVTGRLQFLSMFEMINRYPNPRVHLNCNLQLFREKLSEKVHATILKGIVGCFEFTILQKKKNLKQWHERPWPYACECLKKATKVGSIATVLGTVY